MCKTFSWLLEVKAEVQLGRNDDCVRTPAAKTVETAPKFTAARVEWLRGSQNDKKKKKKNNHFGQDNSFFFGRLETQTWKEHDYSFHVNAQSGHHRNKNNNGGPQGLSTFNASAAKCYWGVSAHRYGNHWRHFTHTRLILKPHEPKKLILYTKISTAVLLLFLYFFSPHEVKLAKTRHGIVFA